MRAAVAGILTLGLAATTAPQDAPAPADAALQAAADAALRGYLVARRSGRPGLLRDQADAAEQACRAAVARDESSAPARVRLARLLRVTDRVDLAWEAAGAAIEADRLSAEARLERVLAGCERLATRARDASAAAMRVEGERMAGADGRITTVPAGWMPPDPDVAIARDPEWVKCRGEILEAAALIADGWFDASAFTPSDRALFDASFAWLLGDRSAARVLADRALAGADDPVPACRLLATVADASGDPAAVLRTCDLGLRAAPGDRPLRERRVIALLASADAASLAGEDPRARLRQARTQAISLAQEVPTDGRTAVLRAGVEFAALLGGAADGAGGVEALQALLGACDAAVEMGPEAAGPVLLRARTRALWAALLPGGVGSAPLLAAADADCTRALHLDPSVASAWLLRAQVGERLAEVQDEGPDASLSRLAQAAADALVAARLGPSDADALALAARCRIRRAGAQPPEADVGAALDAAESELTEAFGRLPIAELLAARARGRWLRASRARARGTLTSGALGDARADLDRWLRLDPAEGGARGMRVDIHRWTAELRTRAGADPVPAYAAALDDADALVAAEASDAASWRLRAEVRLDLCEYLADHGASVPPLHAVALADCDEAIRREPRDPRAFGVRAEIHAAAAEFRAGRETDPESAFAEARADLDVAVGLAPAERRWRMRRAVITADWGGARMKAGGDAASRYAAAIDDYSVVLAAAPDDLEALSARGDTRSWLGQEVEKRGEDPTALHLAAIADLDRALTLAPGDAGARRNRARAHGHLACYRTERGIPADSEHRAAIADLEATLRLDPTRASDIEERLSHHRGHLAGRPGR